MSIRSLVSMSVAAVFALAGCGGGSSSSDDTVPANADLVVTAIDGLAWAESNYTATAGAVVVAATNESSQPHNLHFVDSTGTQLPKGLDTPGRGDIAVDTITLDPGTYTLICTIAGHDNMRATLTVD